jgi:hypothetical protein
MDRTARRQVLLDQRKATALEQYPAMWRSMITEWQRPVRQERVCLMCAANYLFRTNHVGWALDPLTLKQRLPEAAEMDLVHDLEGLSFVLLTHRHKDHLDLNLVHQLSGLPIQWVVPEDLLERVEQAGLSRKKIILPRPMEPLELEGHTITPFDGLHWQNDPTRPEGRRGVPAMGYLVEFNQKRWLFPGDVRTYDINLMPSFGPIDGAFMHLWLGRGSALSEEPPLLEAFGRFCGNLNSRRIIVSHLNEYGREISELWDEDHIRLIHTWMEENKADIIIEPAMMGQCLEL